MSGLDKTFIAAAVLGTVLPVLPDVTGCKNETFALPLQTPDAWHIETTGPERPLVIPQVAAVESNDVTVFPGTGQLALTGYAPILVVSGPA